MTARWRGYSHPELYKMINSGPGPAASAAQTTYWQSLTRELEEVDADLNKALSDLKATWQGAASDSATTGMTPLQAWAGDAQTGSTVMRISSEDQADYISRARAEMPTPVEVTTPAPSTWDMAGAGLSAVLGNPVPAAMVALQAADHERQEAQQAAAADRAVDTMNTYQSSSTWNRNTLGTFSPPPDVVVATPPPAGSAVASGEIGGWMKNSSSTLPSGSTSASSSVVTTNIGGQNGGNPSRPPTPPGTGPVPTPPGGGGGGGTLTQPPGTTPSGFLPPQPPGTMPAPNPTPPGRPPGTPVLPPGTGPGFGNAVPLPGAVPGNVPGGNPTGGRGIPGVPGGFGPEGRGAGGGTGGLGSGSQQQLGRGPAPGLAAAGGEGVINRGAAAAPAGAGARGGAGMGAGPMGAGGSAPGDEDEEHFAPDYLLETNDVFGDDRMVSPAVIGENPAEDER